MANKQEILQERYKFLRIKYNELESFYYDNFRLKAKGTATRIISPENYFIESARQSKEQFDRLHMQFKSSLADALEALDSYKSGFFSDKEYATSVQLRIQDLTKNTDKILYHLNKFELYII